MDEKLATQLGIFRVPLLQAVSTSAVNGHSPGKVIHRTMPVCMQVLGMHEKTIIFCFFRRLGYFWFYGTPGSRDIIPISSAPAGKGLFFVEKKDETLLLVFIIED